MSQQELERRLTALEKQVAELREAVADGAPKKDWRRTLGMFAGDEVMKQIDEEARKIREEDRRRARERYRKKARPAKK